MLTALLLMALQDPPDEGVKLGAPATVTVERAERTAGEVLKAVRTQTGLKISTREFDEDRKVAIAWKEAPVLRALDELCRALGAGDLTINKDEIVIDGSSPLPKAIGHGDRFRFVVQNVQVITTRRLSGTTQNVSVSIKVESLPGTDLSGASAESLVEDAMDDRGWSLMRPEPRYGGYTNLLAEDQEDPDVVEFDRPGWGIRQGGGSLNFQVEPPSADARAIELLRARTSLTFRMRKVDGKIPVAELTPGKEFKVGSMTIKVKSFERKGAQATLDFSHRGGSLKNDRGLSNPFPNFTIVDADGKPVSRGMNGEGSGDGYKYVYQVAEDAEVAAIQYQAWVGSSTKVVRFEIRNIPLPEKK